jgi:CDP-glucose 4,6-dehydratase
MSKDYSSAMENPLGQRLRDLPGPLLLTGHTGFKGTWMTFLLEHLNVPVVGYSLSAEKDSLYERAERTGVIPEAFGDIRDYETLEQFIDLHKPSTIIHMAAQPLVLKSYESPRDTFDVNVMGTVNVLDIAFKKDFVEAIIVVTTDKVYRNDNSGRAFIETDPLEGKDPYSASKVGTESVIAAWQQISKVSGGPRVFSVRAGNVIGGGDFAENRIIPDMIRGVMYGNPVEIRNPQSIRPWQHVLDPLFAYLLVLSKGLNPIELTSLNLGPLEVGITVQDIVDRFTTHSLAQALNHFDPRVINSETLEAKNLVLDSGKAFQLLGIRPRFTASQSIKFTFDWWERVLIHSNEPRMACLDDIQLFMKENIDE